MGVEKEDMSEVLKPSLRKRIQAQDCSAGRDSPTVPVPGNASTTPFEAALRKALKANRIADARTLVANAEAVLFAQEQADATPLEVMTKAQVAAAKSRIAMATGDDAAARAILVNAIESDPNAPALKALMTEVMLAAGRATDVRPVLQHLGNRPSAEQELTSNILTQPQAMGDTSG